jgi:hypothetical protein
VSPFAPGAGRLRSQHPWVPRASILGIGASAVTFIRSMLGASTVVSIGDRPKLRFHLDHLDRNIRRQK